MTSIEIFIVIIMVLIGVGFGYWIGRKKVGGFGTVNEEREKKKAEALAKVRELFQRQAEATNDDVQKLLGVSDATATNYLSELEGESFIVQIGREGRFVKYRRGIL